MMMSRKICRLLLLCLLAIAIAAPSAFTQPPAASAPPAAKKKRSKENPELRAKSLRAIAKRLGVESGAVIADIGAGSGRDTWVFADIVGESGTVYAEEIAKDKVDGIKKEAEKRKLSQVKPVLGEGTDPKLPAGQVDMAFMHSVYHHVSKPKEMLQGIWKALKPGGHFVIVDQRRGTLVDWVPRADRTKKHYWIAETTVVREARENGYVFVDCAEDNWHAKGPFVIVLQRPDDLDAPNRDPDPMSAISADTVQQLLPPADKPNKRVAFVALGEGRELIGPILKASPSAAVDIVLEEWATTKDERPELPENVTLPSVLTEKGDPKLDAEPIDAVYFLDTYHLLFHGPALLAKLGERLTDSGRIYVLDREAAEVIPHRLASHRRMIASETVKQEMAEAGFALLRTAPKPADDRFLLVFGRAAGE